MLVLSRLVSKISLLLGEAGRGGIWVGVIAGVDVFTVAGNADEGVAGVGIADCELKRPSIEF